MGEFIDVLQNDPQNAQAHAYLRLIAQELDHQQKAEADDNRKMLLTEAAKSLDENRMDSRPIQNAIAESDRAAATDLELRRRELCQSAVIQAHLGNLPAANDLVLQVLQDDPSDADAQRALTDLQSEMHDALANLKSLSSFDQALLGGFYAYGQADYAAAAEAWGRVRSAFDPALSASEADRKAVLLHFGTYEKIARAHVNEAHEVTRLASLFGEGVTAYEQQDFDKSLAVFRQVALASPTYPQLGQYLVQAEVASERKRTSDLSDAKRQETSKDFAQGMASLEKGDNTAAKASFEAVLALDPAHPQAKLYLQQIESQKTRRTDPVAGQQHYEAGLIAFVGGDMEQAIREWHIALRFDPENPKVVSALNKVQRELASANELP